jgi:hypothetical protein
VIVEAIFQGYSSHNTAMERETQPWPTLLGSSVGGKVKALKPGKKRDWKVAKSEGKLMSHNYVSPLFHFVIHDID